MCSIGGTMVKQYLENYRQELISQKIDLISRIQKSDMLIKENMELIHYVETSEDKSYDSFSPHIFESDHNKEKLKELRVRQKILQQESEKQNSELKIINNKIEELDDIILVFRNSLNSKNQSVQDEIYRLKLLETLENERKRIARDLHDSTVKNLTGMVHIIELCSKLMEKDPQLCKAELQNLSKSVRDTIQEMRLIIYNLYPDSLENISICSTVKREIDQFKKISDAKFDYTVQGEEGDLLPVITMTILCIIKESCNNAIKHSGAEHISVQIIFTDENIEIITEDDGCGFDVDLARKNSGKIDSGFGMSTMYERVYLLSGEIEIHSEIGKGTKIQVVIPKKGAICNGN